MLKKLSDFHTENMKLSNNFLDNVSPFFAYFFVIISKSKKYQQFIESLFPFTF